MRRFQWYAGGFCAAFAAGCGGFPELIVDETRDAAKAAVEEQIDELVESVIDDVMETIDFPTEILEDAQDGG